MNQSMAIAEQAIAEGGRDFIRDIVQADLDAGRHTTVVTRFPPEPNGYLHIGHAKSICLNFGIAEEFGGRCHLRFDDTNPAKEEQEYIDAIERDVRWLGFDWGKHLYHASDYFEQLYDWAEHLIRAGKAYVDDQTPGRDARQPRHADRARQEQPVPRPQRRGEPRPVPPHAGRRVPQRRPRAARQDRHGVGQHQPARSRALPHPARRRIRAPATPGRIYPSYDYAHGQSDAIEGITHSICTLEFEDHRPLYDWFLDNLPVPSQPHQYEFARLNLTYTVLSKRVLTELVRDGHVNGWDDPRMPTLAGLRRRGVPPAAIRDFVKRIGVAKANSVVDAGMLDFSIREALNKTALRRMAVLRPLKVVIENYPEGQSEELDAVNHPDDPDAGSRKITLRPRALHRARRLHGEPAEEVLPAVARQGGAAALRLFHHLPRGGEERRRRGGRAALHLRSGDPRRQRRPTAARCKATLHWVSAADASAGGGAALQSAVHQARSRRRRTSPPTSIRSSLEVLQRCPRRAGAGAGGNAHEPVQFERQGYFVPRPGLHSRTARCSTAPSDCVIPSPRRSAARLASSGPGRIALAERARGRAHGGLGQGPRQSRPGRDVGRRRAAPARARLGRARLPDFGRASPSSFATGSIADTGPGRLLPWLPVAFGFGIAIYFTAEREPAWWAGVGLAVRVLRRRVRRRGIGRSRFPLALGLRRRRRGLCHRDAQDRPGRASGPGAAGRQRRGRGLCRGARGARAHRPHRGARAVARRRPARAEARPRARLGARRARRRRSAPM